MGTYTYVSKKKCPVCGEETQVTKMRARLLTLKTDDDFCTHYKDANPYLYKVFVCEHCGFAADDTTFEKPMPAKHREEIAAYLKEHPINIPYKEERTPEEAEIAFKLAIFFSERLKAPASSRAGLYLRLGWMHRTTGNEAKEKEALSRAIALYDESLVSERYPIGTMTDTMAMYLIGACSYRVGDIEKATQYISRIMGDQNVRENEKKLFERTRDLWQTIREDQGEA